MRWIIGFAVAFAWLTMEMSFGQSEADLQSEIINGSLKAANETIKGACGCTPIAIDWKTFDTVKKMSHLDSEMHSLKNTVTGFCKADPYHKTLFCKNVANVMVKYRNGDPSTTRKGRDFHVTIDENMASGGYGLKSEIEKF